MLTYKGASMKPLIKNILIVFILIMLFLVHFIPHQNSMPHHVDSWVTISLADHIIKEKNIDDKNPFSEESYKYPKGSATFLAVIKSITRIDLINISQLLPGFFLVILGTLNYLISKKLFGKEKLALTIMALTALSLSNITMLGPYYVVPFAFGLVLLMSFLASLVYNKILLSTVLLISLILVHTTTTLFALTIFLFHIIFSKNKTKKKEIGRASCRERV